MYGKLKNDILGKKYSLSIAFIPPKKSQEINKKYRNKNKPTNVLAFPFSPHEGEILLCPSVIKKEAKKWDKTYEEFMGFLVIHGMLHLKGYKHGRLMEKEEEKYLSRTKFKIK